MSKKTFSSKFVIVFLEDGGLTSRVERRGSGIAIGEHGSGYANVSGVRVGTLTSTSLGDVSSLGDVCELCAASNGTDGQGARSQRETVDSRTSIYHTFAYIGLTSRNYLVHMRIIFACSDKSLE